MATPKTVMIVQARMTSTRLPGKVMLPVLGRPLLSFQIERLNRVTRCDQLCIAVTENPEDDKIVELCGREGVSVFRGSEDDVLSRYLGAAKMCHADVVVRATSDCPLIDPEICDQVIATFFDEGYDYVSNVSPRKFPRGMDTEVFSLDVLEKLSNMTTDAGEREHVTLGILHHPEDFSIGSVTSATDHSHYRWTVDTAEDFALIEKILSEIYPENPKFTMLDVIALLERHPKWSEINAGIRQKKV